MTGCWSIRFDQLEPSRNVKVGKIGKSGRLEDRGLGSWDDGKTGQSRTSTPRPVSLPTRQHLKKNIVQKQYSPFVTPLGSGVFQKQSRRAGAGFVFWKKKEKKKGEATPSCQAHSFGKSCACQSGLPSSCFLTSNLYPEKSYLFSPSPLSPLSGEGRHTKSYAIGV